MSKALLMGDDEATTRANVEQYARDYSWEDTLTESIEDGWGRLSVAETIVSECVASDALDQEWVDELRCELEESAAREYARRYPVEVVFGGWDLDLAKDVNDDGTEAEYGQCDAWDVVFEQVEAALVDAGLPSVYGDRWSALDEGCRIACSKEEADRIVAVLTPICSVLTSPVEVQS